MNIPKETLGLAGEFAAASELCKRGIYTQLTLGNHKSTDLLLDVEEGGMLRVQVKAKQGKEWPACKGVACGKPEMLVLVDFQNKADDQRPDFYILTGEDWKDVVEPSLQSGWGVMKDGHFEYTDGFKGLNVDPKMVEKYKERWDKIREKLNLKSAAQRS